MPLIAPEQLAQALDRIDPRERELLSLSLRRRVPDEALATVFEIDSAEVARRRARAIEHLADEMDLQRGEDLGAVLKALLEAETWNAAAATLGEEFAAGAGGGGARLSAVPLPAEPEPEPEPVSGPTLAPVPPVGEEPEEQEVDTPDPPEPGTVVPAPAEPVLEMLADRDREDPDPPRRRALFALLGMSVVALAGAAGVIGATQFSDSDTIVKGGGGGDDGTRNFEPEKVGALAAPFPTDPQTASCYSTARVRGATVLYREPGGRKRMKLSARTEWNSPRVLGVVAQRTGWLGVQAPELKNGEIAWIRRSEAQVDCARWSLHADLSKRRIVVRRDGRTMRKLTVAVGREENPTPTGRFSVTDKLKVSDASASPYGCCVLALTGHQTDLPPYWPGGDRLAVHATNDGSSIGQPVSLGCMRATSSQVRWLIETIPLGAPIFIRA